jgi:hypothetical protein
MRKFVIEYYFLGTDLLSLLTMSEATRYWVAGKCYIYGLRNVKALNVDGFQIRDIIGVM